MASFLTNLGQKHKNKQGMTILGLPTSMKVQGLNTKHQLQTCICSETIPQDSPTLTLTYPMASLWRHQLQTAISRATAGFEPPDFFQWIRH